MGHSKIQSILFNRKYFTHYKAIQWLSQNGFKYFKVDKTDHYLRYRQFDPKSYKKYRIISFTPIIKAVLEI